MDISSDAVHWIRRSSGRCHALHGGLPVTRVDELPGWDGVLVLSRMTQLRGETDLVCNGWSIAIIKTG